MLRAAQDRPAHQQLRHAADGHVDREAEIARRVLSLFDAVVESSEVGVRKPDPCSTRSRAPSSSIEPPEAVFLDDLGVNLKPARRWA